jgi:hypothetical protein
MGFAPPEGIPISVPNKVRLVLGEDEACGSTALMYVSMNAADCDAPMANSKLGSSGPSSPAAFDARIAFAAWLKMSKDQASPGCCSGS